MKRIGKGTTVRILITGILILIILLVFGVYIRSNSERILRQNADYIKDFTIQNADWIENVLDNARSSINNMAYLYGKTLNGGEINPDDLKEMADRSLFDYVEFIDAEGIEVNARGIHTDVSDRNYFIQGMKGESGMDGSHTSPITNERLVIFYAPVRYQGEIIGVLTGHYREERMRDILDVSLFGEECPAFLCLSDGTIVASVGVSTEGRNILEYIEDKVNPKDLEGIRGALEEEKQYAFAYKTESGMSRAYVKSLPGNQWTIIQVFPVNAYIRMQKQANGMSMRLQTVIVVVFAAYIVFLLLQARYRQKKLSKGKQEAERIVWGINRLYSHFILVDLEKDHYQYMNGKMPSFEGVSPEGVYSKFLDSIGDRFVEEYDMVSMSRVLTREYIQENFREDLPYERYEYQVLRGGDKTWEGMALIVLERRDGKPVSVLLAVQEITGMKQRELRTQTALKEAYQSAEAANHAKSEFLSRMSHDIRTPMNAIMGMTAIAAMHIEDRARVEDCLSKITVSSRHLLGLINEVLDMSKIESGKLELTDEEFDLSETVNELLGIFQPQIEAKGQILSVTLGDVTHEKVIGDSQRLAQVLVNVMGNAVKFTPECGCISLHISEVPSRTSGSGCYEFIITDTGIGMEQEFVDRMFEPFSRATDSRTSHTEGTGLGMAITKNIVGMMNGSIVVSSQKGEGTKVKIVVTLRHAFDSVEELDRLAGHRVMVVDDEEGACENACNILTSINMPSDYYTDGDEAVAALVRANETPQQYAAVILDWKMPKKDGVQITREIREKVGEDMPIIILSAYDWSAIEQEARQAGVNEFIAKPLFKSRLTYVMKKVLLGQEEDKKDLKTVLQQEEEFEGKRVLLVEDNELNKEIASELLTSVGFNVDCAENGKIAVERLMKAAPGTYHVVLMDIQMPIMNGYEAARAVRNSGRRDLASLPIIAMTADAFSDDIRKAEAAGMNGHISKPIDIRKLMDSLKDWVKE